MSKNNVRIAIRDSTDSHNVAFFDNKAGIKYKSANLHRFLAGSASILTIKYNSKDIDSIRSGCKLAFRYKARDYWLNVMSFEKKGFEAELTAYSLGLELNNETRGEHKPANAMSIAEYVGYYDPEHALTIGVNEVSDKRIKLEWTGTDTILARLFSVANSFGAELDFSVELNDDYSLKRQVLNIYKKGNLGTNKVSQPVRVGKELKVINYSDNIKELRTAVRATGKDGLTIDGLDKKIYDNNKELLYYSSGMTVYAPQSRDRFPSVGKGSNDNWIVEDLGETQYETKEALWGYMYGEIQKKSLPEITYEVEGAIEAGIGDTQTLIDDIHFEPTLYVQARVSELEDDILTGKVTKSTFINFERKYSQIADILLKQVEALAEDAAPYIVRLTTDNGYNFKNGQGTSTITAKLEKYSKIVNAKWKWLINNSVVSETSSVKINASQVNGTLNVVAVAIVGGSEAAREYITFTNINDGPQGPQGPQGDEGPKGDKGDTGNGIANTVVTYGLSVSDTTEPTTWASSVPTLVKGMYLWTRTVIIYTNGESTTSYQISYIAKDADATEAIDKTKQELLEKLETVRDDSLASAEEAKQQITAVANDLSTAKQELTSHAQQLQTQANAQTELTKRVSSVEETANGTKTTVSELSKTVAQNGKDITSVTARTKVVEDDLSGTKTTLSQVKTTADSASQKTATLETGLNGVKADLTATTATANTIKTNLANYQATNDKVVANLQSNLQEANGNISSLKTKVEAVPGQITSAVSAVEGKIPTDIGMVNLFKGSRDFSGSWFNGGSGVYSEDYQGVKIFKKNSMWGGLSQFFEVKTGEEYVFSAYVKSSGKTDGVNFYLVHGSKKPMATGLVGYGSDNGQDVVNIGLTDNYKRIAIKIKITKDGWIAPRIERYNSDNYLYFGGYKLERGNIATNWAPASEDYDSNLASLEGKIPTNLDSLNLMTGTRDWSTKANKWHMGANWSTESGEYQGLKVHSTRNGWNGSHQNIFVKNGDVITFSFFAKADSTLSNIKVSSRWPDSSVYQAPLAGVKESDEQITITSEWKRYSKTIHITSDGSLQFRTEYDGATIPNGNTFYVAGLKLAKSSLDTGYSENPTDIASDITKLDTSLTQTANGLKQLSTQVTSQGGTITSHTNSINSLTTGLQAKVSQSDFNTLSGRVTTAENNIIAKANELSSKISSVEGKLPSGEINLVEYGRPADGYSPYYGAEYTTHKFYYNSSFKMYIIRNTSTKEKVFGMNRFKVERNTDYTLYFKGFNNGRVTNMDVWFLKRVNGSKNDWDSAQALVSGRKFSTSRAEDVSVTFNTGNYDEGYIRFDNNGTTTAGTSADLYFGDVSVKKGKSNNGWSPSLAELASSQALKNAQSEFKQTTDAIKASVSSLDNSTVKSSSLTINADGIVMKAGKSTTDVANAIGSYFAVNQNAINLFSDKIKVKGNMIVSGSISSDKIAASGITANVIKGGTLQSVNGSTNFELNTGKLFYNNNNTGVFRVQNGASTMGLKFSNTPITVSGTSRILSRAILGGDRNETTLDDGKWDKGGFSGIVIETIKGAIPAANEHADSLRAISDTIYFTHTYSADSPTGVSAHGWKMETYAPDSSYPGNIVLKPYGINYRQSDIIVGDVRLDNGDGSGYWMRATINTLKACFGHILNGGTSSQALNAIRSELNKISGT